MHTDIISQRLSLLTPEYREMVQSGFAQKSSDIFSEFLNLTQKQQVLFENGFVLYLLLFLNRDELTYFFVTNCLITPEKAKQVIQILIDDLPQSFVSAHIDAYKQINGEVAEQLNDSTRIKVLQNIPAYKVRFYLFLHNLESVQQLLQKTPSISQSDFVTLIGDLVLGFYKIEDTVPLLQQELGLDPRTAALLGADVIDFLAPLKDPNWQSPVAEGTDLSNEVGATPTVETAQPIPTKAPIPSGATVTPTAQSLVAPVYTPQQYTPATEPVYQSSQPTRADLSGIPSYMPNAVQTPTAPTPTTEPDRPRPRWSSEF